MPAAAAVPSITTVQALPPAATVGQTVQLNATVTCTSDPSGGAFGVTFFDGPNLLGSQDVDVNGNVTYDTSFDTPGTHLITAAYNGNSECGASNAETTVEVAAAPPVPPTPPGGFCLFACDSLIGFSVGDINNSINVR